MIGKVFGLLPGLSIFWCDATDDEIKDFEIKKWEHSEEQLDVFIDLNE